MINLLVDFPTTHPAVLLIVESELAFHTCFEDGIRFQAFILKVYDECATVWA